MTSTAISHACAPACSLLIASPISATRVTANPRWARMMPTCSAWSGLSSMSSTLVIAALDETFDRNDLLIRNCNFPAMFQTIDRLLVEALGQLQRSLKVGNADNDIENVQTPVIPC